MEKTLRRWGWSGRRPFRRFVETRHLEQQRFELLIIIGFRELGLAPAKLRNGQLQFIAARARPGGQLAFRLALHEVKLVRAEPVERRAILRRLHRADAAKP